ncbi:MAG TPA: bacterial transcriptional activator domain-containing protein [Ktedonobacteraceae bacterium]|nr:bacterial transcriptional activator domain-containing protein [Ktedonobacteraceae bacterium]
MTIDTSPLDAPSRIRSFQLLSLAGMAQVPAPLVRVTTCGLLTLELFEDIISTNPLQARYRVLTPDLLHGRGVIPALTLLKLLTSRPERFAPNEWLREQFCQAQGEAFSSKRLDTLASLLRDLLCPSDYQDLRTALVANIRAMSGSGYRLAASPLIWLDHEALAWNVEQAIRMERFGDNPLPFWQRAYELAKRGEYLPDEVYGEWASVKREQIAGMLRQSVQALARLYADQNDKASEEEALLLLRTYWQEHPHDEDALRLLMELLGRRECYQEALAYYEKLCALLKEEGEQPSKQTQDVAEYVRAKQIQRISAKAKRMDKKEPHQYVFEALHPFSSEQMQRIIQEMSHIVGASDMDTLRRAIAQSLFGMAAATVATPSVQLADLDLLERFSRVLSRPSHLDTTAFSELENHTASYWQHRLQATLPSSALLENARTHFFLLIQLLQGPLTSSERQPLCALASETAQAIGMLLFDLRQYAQARNYFHLAIRAAQEARHPLLEIVAWGNLSFAWMYDEYPQKALPCIQKARLSALANPDVPLMIQAELTSREAEILSLLGERDACLNALDLAERGAIETSHTVFGIHFDIARWAGYQGACFRRLSQQKSQETHAFLTQAEQALQTALCSVPASQLLRRSTLELDLAEVLFQKHDLENASQHALQAAILTERTGSRMVSRRLHLFRQQMGKVPLALLQSLDHQLTLLTSSE